MSGRLLLAALLAATGCNQVFGLDPPVVGTSDGGADDEDAGDDAGGDIDAREIDAGCANSGHDEDADGIFDACDNCPHVANVDQLNGDGDGVGNSCDPRPSQAGDRILMFLPFDVMPTGMTFEPANTGQWASDGERLRLLVPTGAHLARMPVGLASVSVTTSFEVDTFVTATEGQYRSAGVWARISPTPSNNPGTPFGLVMQPALEVMGGVTRHFIQLAALEPSGTNPYSRFDPPGFTFAAGQKYFVNIDALDTAILASAAQQGVGGGTVQLNSTALGAGDVGLRTYLSAVSFQYLFVTTRDDSD